MAWLLLIAFGAYHGLNPAMGWLFALSNGLQQRSARGILSALVPIAAGHSASVAVVAIAVVLGLRFFSSAEVQIAMALLLLAFGTYKLATYWRHPRWVGMKLGTAGLFGWSFVMATAHGAGVMVGPILAGVATEPSHHGALVHAGGVFPWTAGNVALAVALHTASMLVVMGAVALVVYRYVGLSILRRAWVNFDLVWAVALLAVGGIAIATVDRTGLQSFTRRTEPSSVHAYPSSVSSQGP